MCARPSAPPPSNTRPIFFLPLADGGGGTGVCRACVVVLSLGGCVEGCCATTPHWTVRATAKPRIVLVVPLRRVLLDLSPTMRFMRALPSQSADLSRFYGLLQVFLSQSYARSTD